MWTPLPSPMNQHIFCDAFVDERQSRMCTHMAVIEHRPYSRKGVANYLCFDHRHEAALVDDPIIIRQEAHEC